MTPRKFAKFIHPVYVLLDWVWASTGRVPTADEIEIAILDRIVLLKKSGGTKVSSGGLFAQFGDNPNVIHFGFEMLEELQ